MHSPRLFTLVSLALLVAAPAHGTPIQVLSATFRSTLQGYAGAVYVDRTVSGSNPVSDSLHLSDYANPSWPEIADIETRAGMFSVFTDTGTINTRAYASAETQVQFVPRTDGTAPLGILVRYGGVGYVRSLVSLLDLTDSELLWSYTLSFFPGIQVLSQPTALDVAHTYQLTLFAWSEGVTDQSSTLVEVSGFEVPDPGSTLLLFGISLVGLRVGRKRWQ